MRSIVNKSVLRIKTCSNLTLRNNDNVSCSRKQRSSILTRLNYVGYGERGAFDEVLFKLQSNMF